VKDIVSIGFKSLSRSFPGAKRNPCNKVEWGWEGSLQMKYSRQEGVLWPENQRIIFLNLVFFEIYDCHGSTLKILDILCATHYTLLQDIRLYIMKGKTV